MFSMNSMDDTLRTDAMTQASEAEVVQILFRVLGTNLLLGANMKL